MPQRTAGGCRSCTAPEFHYSGPVRSSYNEARLTPENSNRQTTLRSRVEIEPAATALRLPRLLGLHGHRVRPAQPARGAGGHRRRRSSRPARTSPGTTGSAGARWPPREVRDQFGELLRPDAADRHGRRRGGRRRRDVVGDARPHEAGAAGLPVRATSTWSTCPGSTNVKTNAMQAWTHGQGRLPGHLARHRRPAARRSACPPATSRATCTRSRTPAIGEPVTGESHAWVEWWDGGWNGFDPTNSVEIGTRHVTLGRGRDYGDVPPFKGLFSGPEERGSHGDGGGHPPGLKQTPLPPTTRGSRRDPATGPSGRLRSGRGPGSARGRRWCPRGVSSGVPTGPLGDLGPPAVAPAGDPRLTQVGPLAVCLQRGQPRPCTTQATAQPTLVADPETAERRRARRPGVPGRSRCPSASRRPGCPVDAEGAGEAGLSRTSPSARSGWRRRPGRPRCRPGADDVPEHRRPRDRGVGDHRPGGSGRDRPRAPRRPSRSAGGPASGARPPSRRRTPRWPRPPPRTRAHRGRGAGRTRATPGRWAPTAPLRRRGAGWRR